MINLKAILQISKLIYTQSISKSLYIIFVFFIPFLFVAIFTSFLYISHNLDNYEKLLYKGYFGYFPKISISFDNEFIGNNIQRKKVLYRISKLLTKKNFYNSKVYSHKIGDKFSLCDKQNKPININGNLVVYYNNEYFHKKFNTKSNMVITKIFYAPLSSMKNIVFMQNKEGNKFQIKNFKIIDVGLLKIESALIVNIKVFKLLKERIYPTNIYVASSNIKKIQNIINKNYKIIYKKLKLPKNAKKLIIKTYREDKELKETSKQFKNLKILKNTIIAIIITLIFFLIIATMNSIKELKEREFEILKRLGFTTFEIVFAFIIVELLLLFLPFITSIGLFSFIAYQGNFLISIKENIYPIEFLFIGLCMVVSLNILYLWRILRYEKFN